MRKKIIIASLAIIFLFGIVAVKAQNVSSIIDKIIKQTALLLYDDIRSVEIELPNDIEEIIKLGSSFRENEITLTGLSADAYLLPDAYVFANNTTTAAIADGGMIQQRITTAGLDNVYLAVSAVGAVSTSTMYIRPMVSWDGTDYFDIATSSASLMGTTTATTINSYIRAFTPGTATSTKVFKFPEIKGAKYTRFIMYGAKDGDLNLGVQAHIIAVKIESY